MFSKEKNNLRKKGKRYILKPDPSDASSLILFRVRIKNGETKYLQVVREDEQDQLYEVIHTASKHAGSFCSMIFFLRFHC